MLFSTSLAIASLSLFSISVAQPVIARDAPEAYVTVETNLGGAFGDVEQHTIVVPIGSLYTNQEALAAVSTLYLKGANGVAKESVTCTPYKGTNGAGNAGQPFTSENPSHLSTNTVVVGSLYCRSE